MSDNPRPVLYGSGYETFLPRATDADRSPGGAGGEQALRVRRRAGVGGHVPDDLVVGDRLATPVSGAYGPRWDPTTTSPRPPVLFVRDSDARVVVRRETYDDLLRLDC